MSLDIYMITSLLNRMINADSMDELREQGKYVASLMPSDETRAVLAQAYEVHRKRLSNGPPDS